MRSLKEIETRKIAARFSSEGLLVQKEALDVLLSNYREPQELDDLVRAVVSKVREEGSKFVEPRHVSEAMGALHITRDDSRTATGQTGFAFAPMAKDVDEEVSTVFEPKEGFDLSDDLGSCLEHFKDRHRAIGSIMRSRLDMTGVMTLSEVYSMPDGQKAKAIVMVSEKRNMTLHVEDPTAQGKVRLSKNANAPLREKFGRLIPDIVVGLWIVKFRGMWFCEDIIYPDVPDSRPRLSDKKVAALLTSDFHIGSKYFMEKGFHNFLRWLRGEAGDSASLDSASKIKYILIAGDLVDGIGIYPNQDKELEIKSSYGQYEKAAELLSQIPDYVRVLVIPGNHDFTRKALPQPPIPKEQAQPLFDLGTVTFLANPAMVSLHKVHFQLFHGQSLEDLAGLVPAARHDSPEVMMEYLISVRHLAPFYGGKTEIQTTGPDRLIVADKPDVFHAGHVHIFGAKLYRGVSVVNSGTWQTMTPYQQMMGVKPTPGMFALYHMDTGELNRVRLEQIA